MEYHHQNSNFAKVFNYEFWMKGSMNRKRVEEVREAKTKLEAQKAETVVKIQEVGNSNKFLNRRRKQLYCVQENVCTFKNCRGQCYKILDPSA